MFAEVDLGVDEVLLDPSASATTNRLTHGAPQIGASYLSTTHTCVFFLPRITLQQCASNIVLIFESIYEAITN